MKKKLLSVVILLTTFVLVYGNETNDTNKQKLTKNGISIVESDKTYTDYQYDLLANFDFNSYRNYTTTRLVQIEDGPIIQLSSLVEIQKIGKPIPTELLENKKGEAISSNLKSIITLVNIGFRYGPKKNTETGF